jgi:predicted transposase YbfD/YdcC
MDGLDAWFAELKDPRPSGTRRRDLLDVMMIALCAVLSGGRTAVDMAVFAEAKHDFLGKFLRLRKRSTEPRHLQSVVPPTGSRPVPRACFQKFVARFGDTCSDVIAIDGKALPRPSDPHRAGSALHMISAWSCEKRLVLAQIAADHKSRESAAVLELLKFLSLRGTTVTTDALNRRRDIVRQIVEKGGDYALALKGNHRAQHADVSLLLKDPRWERGQKHLTADGDRGRIETHTSLVCTEVAGIQKRHRWPGLRQ